MAKKTGKIAAASKKKVAPKYLIGILHSGSDKEGDHKKHIKELKASLSKIYPKSLVKYDEAHYAKDNPVDLGNEAKSLAEKSDLLVASGGSLALTTLLAARANYGKLTTPIVFTSVSYPPSPTAHLTGVNALTSESDTVRLDILFELLGRPRVATKIRAIKNPRRPYYDKEVDALKAKALQLNSQWGAAIEIDIKDVGYSATIDQNIKDAFSGLALAGVTAVLVTADPLFYNRRSLVIEGAKDANVPTIYQWRQFVEEEGLISYGTKLKEAYQMAGAYVGLILKDMDAHGGLPTQTLATLSPSFELVINSTTADDQGIEIPPLLSARAELIT